MNFSLKPGAPFMIHLLMREKCELPSEERMTDVMASRVGGAECFSYSEDMAGFVPHKYSNRLVDGTLPPQLLIMRCTDFDHSTLDTTMKSQMWDCLNSEEILAVCRYHVMATDMLASGMKSYVERADMLMDFVEALVELFPTCEAVLFRTSGKMLLREKILNHKVPRKARFVYFAVNFRIFDIQGSDDMIVDSVGMSTLCLPDVQYHFRDIYPDWIINHACRLLSQIYTGSLDLDRKDTVDGMRDGLMCAEVQWKCRYQKAFMPPGRWAVDVAIEESDSDSDECFDNPCSY